MVSESPPEEMHFLYKLENGRHQKGLPQGDEVSQALHHGFRTHNESNPWFPNWWKRRTDLSFGMEHLKDHLPRYIFPFP